MGGDISVTSKVGTGSSFRMKVLLSEVTSPSRVTPIDARVSGYHGLPKTILITDDDPTQRDLLREVLAPLGFVLLSAPDGATCLSLAQHCNPDLFILDISMPQMDGWAVAEALQATGHRKAKILMLSASALEAHGRSLAQQLHDGYLMKPLDIPRLLGEIGRLLKIEWKHGVARSRRAAALAGRAHLSPTPAHQSADPPRRNGTCQGTSILPCRHRTRAPRMQHFR